MSNFNPFSEDRDDEILPHTGPVNRPVHKPLLNPEED